MTANNGDTNLPERVELVTCQRRLSMLAESFRATLASILFAWQQGRACPIMVLTSAAPAEGKTMITTNLALAMSETHRKVLLIDADLRKPRIHHVFSLANTAGLSDLLKRSEPLTEFMVGEAAQSTEIPGVDVITSGPGASNLSNLLYSARVPELFRIVRQKYDAVLIDTPPMLQMPDARILARHADGVILVLRAGRTTRDTAVLAKERFLDDGTPVLGTILNDWNAKTRSGSGYHGYYKGYYEYHGNNGNGHQAPAK
jgi:capsular exopolysaccharide synthesis family protein